MERTLDELILEAYTLSASDLFLKADGVPSIRQHGKVTPLPGGYARLTADEVTALVNTKMSARQQAIFEQHHEMDLAFFRRGRAAHSHEHL